MESIIKEDGKGGGGAEALEEGEEGYEIGVECDENVERRKKC